MKTVFGIACNELGHVGKRVLERGASGPELRFKTWETRADQVAVVQESRIPVDRDHDGVAIGEVIALELRNGNLWAVAHVDDDVVEAVNVRVGDELIAVEHPLYWSVERIGGACYRDIVLTAVSLTPWPAAVGARPVTLLPGALDHRAAPRRWRLDPFQRELLTRAAHTHLDRRRGAPIIVRDAPTTTPTPALRTSGPVHVRPPGRVEHGPTVSGVIAVS